MRNDFYADPKANIAFFIGKEPNINWIGFADCIFDVAKQLGRGADHLHGQLRRHRATHARAAPLRQRFRASPPPPSQAARIAPKRLRRSGQFRILPRSGGPTGKTWRCSASPPRSPATLKVRTRSASKRSRVASSRILGVPVDLAKLREASTDWEMRVTQEVEKNDEMAQTVRKLEEEYDNELIEQAND